jgi:hypothetical protein
VALTEAVHDQGGPLPRRVSIEVATTVYEYQQG